MTRHQKAAAQAVAADLANCTTPLTLFDVSCVADQGAYAAGRKTELFLSLYDYGDLLPSGWRQLWLKSASSGPTGDSLLMCCPPGWQEGCSDSEQLLLGAGKLVCAGFPD